MFQTTVHLTAENSGLEGIPPLQITFHGPKIHMNSSILIQANVLTLQAGMEMVMLAYITVMAGLINHSTSETEALRWAQV